MHTYEAIEKHMMVLITRLTNTLDDVDIEYATELVHAGEYGVSLEFICEQLYENEYTITMDIYRIIVDLCMTMNIPKQHYEMLKENIKDSS